MPNAPEAEVDAANWRSHADTEAGLDRIGAAVAREAAAQRVDLARAIAGDAAAPAALKERVRGVVERALWQQVGAENNYPAYFLVRAIEAAPELGEALTRSASLARFRLDMKPAGSEHREFIRNHGGPRSIDDIDD